MTELFSARLKASTATIHDEVEHTNFMVDLMEGRLDSRAYALLLTQYTVIYSALEAKSREFAEDPIFAPFHDADLFRGERIARDLQELTGSEEFTFIGADLPITGSAEAYARHLGRLDKPEQVIAHHYTRYLGDLSGGQAIGALMGRHYDIPASALTIWDFTELGKTKPYKDSYRLRLNDIAGTGGNEQTVIDETMTAFELNGELLSELTSLADRPGAAGRPAATPPAASSVS
ncbi:biliverdin-producing heme oxygenase [Brevibacterium sp. RIT 803]|uniref:biliverdin-producing heme oxygenase n=1 Tax=Brevibacterium sp. RIT 803 TaxID=2810210 RepID=UPI0019521785|nr:biliverdin-producing heme oxygenase [Brevibacterium sp. RIT 803]MBM6589008.1 biliverdin-producing heme oxygenase [Brevibacterium sp. RIT 803]